MRFKFFTSFLTFIMILAMFTGCEEKKSNPIVTKQGVTSKVILKDALTKRKIPLTVLTPKEVIFDDFKGDKIVLVNFFATWCPPCKAEIPHLVNLQRKYKDDFVIVSVLLEDQKDPEEVRSFINYYNINYIVTDSSANYDFEKLMGGVSSIPAMYLFTKKGLVYQNYVGAVDEEILSTDIKKAISK